MFTNDSRPVAILEYLLQYPPVIGVHVNWEEVKLAPDFILCKELQYIVWPEHDLLKVNLWVLIASIHE